MHINAKLIAILAMSCVGAIAGAAPASAAAKPCCHNDGEYFNSTPSTCQRYGGRVVPQEYCQRDYQGDYQFDYQRGYRNDYEPSRRGGGSFSVSLGGVVFAYSDGYYDRNRRWHGWRSNAERNWYRQNRRDSYYHMRRDHDRDRNRRDWRDGRRDDWRTN